MAGSFLKSMSLLAVITMLSLPLYAQSDKERATREVDESGRKVIEEKLIPKATKPAEISIERAPAPKEEKKLFIKKINLTGCETCPKEYLIPLIAKYEGREVSVSELNELVKKIKAEYVKKKIVAGIFFSPEEIRDGVVNLRIVEARMGELIIKGNKYFKDKIIKKYWKITPGQPLRYDDISRCVQMMNQNPDREVKAILRAGSKAGTTDVVLSSKTRFPGHVVYNFDNDGTIFTGVLRQIIGVRHNNLLGLDDMLLSGYSFGESYSGYYVYHNVPVSDFGTYVLYGYSHSSAIPKKDYEQFDERAKSDVLRGSIHQDLYSRDKYLGDVSLEFAAKDKTVTSSNNLLNRDKLRILNFSGTFPIRDPGSITYFMPEFSQGLGEAFGATPEDNTLASNLAKPVFSKFSLDIFHKEMLPFDVQEIVKLRSQYSPSKLTPQEQLYLGGIDSIRGYPPGNFYCDNAILTNLEFLIPAFFLPDTLKLLYAERPLKDELKGLLFADYGFGTRRDQDKAHNLLGLGAGIRMRLYNQVNLRLEWGFPMWAQTPESRFYFAIDFQDKLPEELARISREMKEQKEPRGAGHKL